MKPRTLISLFTLALASSSTACTAATDPAATGPAADEPSATSDQAIVAPAGNIIAWPTAPIAWTGLTGTWPISVWSPAPIGAIAFDLAGLTHLGLTVAGYPNLTAVPITTPYLNAFHTALSAPLLGSAGLNAPAYGFTGLYAPYTLPAWAGAWLTPAITSSALMITNLAALNTFTPYMFNVTFTAQSAAHAAAITQAAATSTAALSIFATPIMPTALAAQTAAIPLVSAAYPIMLPLPASSLATAALL
jgi:hypothetical protein